MKSYAFFIVLMLAYTSIFSTENSWISDKNRPVTTENNNKSKFKEIPINFKKSLNAEEFLIELQDSENAKDLSFSIEEEYLISESSENIPHDIATSENGRYENLYEQLHSEVFTGNSYVENFGEIVIDNKRYLQILIFPRRVNNDGQMFETDKIDIRIGTRYVSSTNLIHRDKAIRESNLHSTSLSAATRDKYVIVTNSNLKSSFEKLQRFKIETGYDCEIKLIEDIIFDYSGRDNAEKLREYLKEFYRDGGQYVLLGGDETILPLRYAFPYNRITLPSLDQLQICDLYFADVDGAWDVDDDNIWGEPTQDAPDITAELSVGRLPFNKPDQVLTYTNNLIQYVTFGDNTATDYLTKTFFFSSDQMRDDPYGSQHNFIAGAFPNNFIIDTTTGVEAATGDDASPSNTSPNELKSNLLDGYGFINVIAHGRYDGFAVKSSGYNGWPKEYLFTAQPDNNNDNFKNITNQDKPSFYYSLACETGAFDFDQPPLNVLAENFSEYVMGIEGGAVAMVVNSRWGWVSSSQFLHRAFYDSLFSHPELPAIIAMNEVKEEFYYIADLVYGQLFLGDPSIVLHTSTPERLSLEINLTGQTLTTIVTNNTSFVSNCRVIISDSMNLIADLTADASGEAIITYPFDPIKKYVVTVVKENSLVAQASFIGSIVTNVDDSNSDKLPESFTLSQNYPNPFNPTTTINFSLPYRSHVHLEIFNTLGRTIKTLMNQNLSAGNFSLTWDGKNNASESVASGIYFYRLATEEFVETKKMIFIK